MFKNVKFDYDNIKENTFALDYGFFTFGNAPVEENLAYSDFLKASVADTHNWITSPTIGEEIMTKFKCKPKLLTATLQGLASTLINLNGENKGYLNVLEYRKNLLLRKKTLSTKINKNIKNEQKQFVKVTTLEDNLIKKIKSVKPDITDVEINEFCKQLQTFSNKNKQEIMEVFSTARSEYLIQRIRTRPMHQYPDETLFSMLGDKCNSKLVNEIVAFSKELKTLEQIQLDNEQLQKQHMQYVSAISKCPTPEEAYTKILQNQQKIKNLTIYADKLNSFSYYEMGLATPNLPAKISAELTLGLAKATHQVSLDDIQTVRKKYANELPKNILDSPKPTSINSKSCKLENKMQKYPFGLVLATKDDVNEFSNKQKDNFAGCVKCAYDKIKDAIVDGLSMLGYFPPKTKPSEWHRPVWKSLCPDAPASFTNVKATIVERDLERNCELIDEKK